MKRYKWSFFIMLLIGIFAITGIHPASAQAKTNRKVTKAYMEKYAAVKKRNQKQKIQVSYAIVKVKGLKQPIMLIQRKLSGRKHILVFWYQKGNVIKTKAAYSNGIKRSKHLVLRTDGNYLLAEDSTINGCFANLYYWEKNFIFLNKKMQALAILAHLSAYNEKKSSYLSTGDEDYGILGRRIGPNQVKYTQKDVSKTLLAKHPRAKKRHLSYSNFKKVKFRTKKMKY